jgi:hypothetical protein
MSITKQHYGKCVSLEITYTNSSQGTVRDSVTLTICCEAVQGNIPDGPKFNNSLSPEVGKYGNASLRMPVLAKPAAIHLTEFKFMSASSLSAAIKRREDKMTRGRKEKEEPNG